MAGVWKTQKTKLRSKKVNPLRQGYGGQEASVEEDARDVGIKMRDWGMGMRE